MSLVEMTPHCYSSTHKASGKIVVTVGGIEFTADTESEALDRVENMLLVELGHIRELKLSKKEKS